jgi:hypothetical protein
MVIKNIIYSMKKTILFAASILLATSVPIVAAAGNWSAPSLPATPEGRTVESGQTYYLLNVGTGRFLANGNDWGTRAYLSDSGNKVFVKKRDGGFYTLQDLIVLYNGGDAHTTGSGLVGKWGYFFVDNGCGWADHQCNTDTATAATPVDQDLWILKETSDGIYTLANKTDATKFAGWNGTDNDYNISSRLTDAQAVHWKFITPSDYEANINDVYRTALKHYPLMLDLYSLLNKAEAAGVSTESAAAIYNGANSTTEQLNAAIEQLKAALNNASLQGATAANPKDATSCIINPNFDLGNAGWTLSGEPYTTPTTQYTGNFGACSYNSMESWNSIRFDIFQVLKGMPDGVYNLGVNGFYRYGANEDAVSSHKDGTETLNSFLYGANDSTELKNVLVGADKNGTVGFSTDLGYLPNSMSEGRSYFDAGVYPNSLYVTKEGGDTLRLGIKKNSGLANDWTLFSNFTLKYLGAGSDAYKLLLKYAVAKAIVYADGDYKMGNDVLSSINEAIDKANGMIAGTTAKNDEIKLLSKQLGFMVNDVKASIVAYGKLKASFTDVVTCIGQFGGDELSDYYTEIQSAWENGDLTTQQCYSASDSLVILIEYTKSHAVQIGDCSYLIKNPGFSSNVSAGWTFDNCSPSNVDQSEIEFWQRDFDMSQTLKGLRNGKYTVRCKGFYRAGSNGKAYEDFKVDNNDLCAKFYANGDESRMENIMAEAQKQALYLNNGVCGSFPYDYLTTDGTAVPNSMAGARIWLDAGFYNSNSVSTVVTNNVLKFGVRLTNHTTDDWCLVDSFTIDYEGTDASVLKPTLDALTAEAKGLVGAPMNADSLALLKKAIGDVSNSSAQTIAIIAGLDNAISAAEKSIASYAALRAVVLAVKDTLDKSTYPEGLDALSAVYSDVNAKFVNGLYADDEIPSAIAILRTAVTKYLMTPAKNANDNQPCDVSSVIVNAGFDNDVSGWTVTGVAGNGNFGRWLNSSVESWNSTSFDIGQTIVGLPEGTYRLGVTGFYRCGVNESAAEAHTGGTESLNAILYANDVARPLISVFSCPMAEMVSADFFKVAVPFNGKDSCYVPNSMDAVRIAFDSGLYTDNSLYVDVTDGTLKIGVRKVNGVDGDWTMLDTFRLTYYGSNSSHKGTGISDAAENHVVVSTICYSLNGTILKKPVRGVNIVKTIFSDGTIKMHKILVR